MQARHDESRLPLTAGIEALAVPGSATAEVHRAGTLRSLATETAEAAFFREQPGALEDAHRALYCLYEHAVWKPQSDRATARHAVALFECRSLLEDGFQSYLERRVSDPSGGNGDARARLSTLALKTELPNDVPIGDFVRNTITLSQMSELVAQRSLFFLREPDPWLFAVPTLTGSAKAGLINLLLDEYGWGKYERMHSTIYARLMAKLGLETGLDAYRDRASWQFIATLNYLWMTALNPILSRRLVGYIYLTEADSPGAMKNYLAAWSRLGIEDPEVIEFYDLHLAADESHQAVALDEVAVPLAENEPGALDEIARGITEARTLENDFAAFALGRFEAGESSLGTALPETTLA